MRRILESQVEGPGITDLPGSGGVDFICRQGLKRFHIEAACISTAAAEQFTGIKDQDFTSVQCFQHLGYQVYQRCRDKTAQCAGRDFQERRTHQRFFCSLLR